MGLTADQTLNKCCATLVRDLVSINAPDTYAQMRNYGVLNALESPQNALGIDGGIKDALQSKWGNTSILDAEGNCSIKIRVRKPTCGEATADRTSLCELDSQNTPQDDRVDLDLRVTKAFSQDGTFGPEDFFCLCDGGSSEMLNREVTKAAKKILNSVNLDLADMVASAMGNYVDGTDSKTSPKTLNIFNSAPNGFVVQPVGWSPLMLQYMLMQTTGGVIAVGGDEAWGYSQALNLTSGINPGSYTLPNGISIYYDPAVQAMATEGLPNWLYTWAPGALWLMRWLSNDGGDAHVPSPDVTRTIVPIFGQLFDLDIKRVADCDKWIWVLNYSYDLFDLPAELWADCLETNQKQAYQIGCDAFECTDFVQTPPEEELG